MQKKKEKEKATQRSKRAMVMMRSFGHSAVITTTKGEERERKKQAISDACVIRKLFVKVRTAQHLLSRKRERETVCCGFLAM